MSEENHNTLPEDFFTRDFPYDTLERCKPSTKSDILKQLDMIKTMTKHIDISQCSLYGILINSGTTAFTPGRGYDSVITAIYTRKNEHIELGIRGINLLEATYNRKNFMETSMCSRDTLNVRSILELSKSFKYINNDENLFQIKHDENEYESYLSRYYHYFYPHNFGDREVLIKGEVYYRYDIIKPLIDDRIRMKITKPTWIYFERVHISSVPPDFNLRWCDDTIMITKPIVNWLILNNIHINSDGTEEIKYEQYTEIIPSILDDRNSIKLDIIKYTQNAS